MKKAIPAAVLLAAAGLALSGCSQAASSAPAPAVPASASPAPSPSANEVSIEEYLVGKWHCKGDTAGEVQFFGMDSNLNVAIQPVVEFESSGIVTQYDDPGWKQADYFRDDEWEYRDGILSFGQSWAKLAETVPVPGTVEVLFGLGKGPDDSSESSKYDSKTDVTFGPDSMTMKVAQYLDGHEATNPGQTVTCRK